MMATAIHATSQPPVSPAGGAKIITNTAPIGTTLAAIQVRRLPKRERVRSER